MKAKEMFEELGYKLIIKDEEKIKYEVNRYTSTYTIEIWKIPKDEPCLVRKERLNFRGVVNFWAEEIKAINKQIEELNWFEEGKNE